MWPFSITGYPVITSRVQTGDVHHRHQFDLADLSGSARCVVPVGRWRHAPTKSSSPLCS